MQWSHYKDGLLAKSKNGYLFVFSRLEAEAGAKRWFAKYEPGIHFFADKGYRVGRLHGYVTAEEAKLAAEQAAQSAELQLS